MGLKNSTTILNSADVADLRKESLQFGTEQSQLKLKMLNKFSKLPLQSPKVICDYHDTLLFICAHPDNKQIMQFAEKELQRISEIVIKLMKSGGKRKQASLSGSGIYGSDVIASFSYELIRSMVHRHSEEIIFHSCDISEYSAQEIFRFGMLPLENDLSDKKEMSYARWLKSAFGIPGKHAMGHIIRHFEVLPASREIRDHLYDSMKIFIGFQPFAKEISRTFGRAPAGEIYFHTKKPERNIDLSSLLNEKLPAPERLSQNQKQAYVDLARTSLLLNFRETDPVTFAETVATEVYEFGRGISVALYTMRSDRRLPLESYIGYMAFRNRIPCAYGGGWIFRNKSRIGINILPPFRGGESALLFGKILQLYKQRFKIDILEAEPYQIGRNNPDGIRSGAFWFYYRLGFRPTLESNYKIAEGEQTRIREEKKHRTSFALLTRLASSNMVLNVKTPGSLHLDDTADANRLSQYVSEVIASRYTGDRGVAQKIFEDDAKKILSLKSLNGWSVNQKIIFSRMAPVIALIPERGKLNQEQRTQLSEWIRSRDESSELHYILMTHKLEKIWKQFDRLHANKLNVKS